jgi:hypothetical protein
VEGRKNMAQLNRVFLNNIIKKTFDFFSLRISSMDLINMIINLIKSHQKHSQKIGGITHG